MKRFCVLFLLTGFFFDAIFSTAIFSKECDKKTKDKTLVNHSGRYKAGGDSLRLVFSCSPENDLYLVVKESGIKCSRYQTPAESIQNVCEGGGVLLLADNYPALAQTIPPEVFSMAAKKHVRLYIEYPAKLPEIEVGLPQHADLERGVITSGVFSPELTPMEIVVIHDCYFVPAVVSNPYITLAKVAGFDKAVYGLPKDTRPLLFQHPNGRILVSTTKLSQFVTARYAPIDSWDVIWRMILGWLQPGLLIHNLKWIPIVHPSYTQDELLPSDVERQAIRRGLEWVLKAHLLIHPSWKDIDWGKENQIQPNRFSLPIGNGSEGLVEGHRTKIKFDGNQPLKWQLRSDNCSEQAASFVLGGQLLKEPKWIEIGKNLHDFSLFKFDATAPWNNPQHPAFGLISFYTKPEDPAPMGNSFFGAINARICMSALTSGAVLDEKRWDDRVLQVMLANFRTTGQNGLREDALNPQNLDKNGWQYYFNQSNLTLAPYPEAQLLAMNLAIYKTTGYQPLLDRTRKALRLLMQAYPDKWRFYNGMQQDRARMLLPLSWLVRVDDTPEHREWLIFMTSEFIKYQVNCGAIPEELGRSGPGKETFKEQKSNENYGISETSIIANNGDPGCDLLYTLSSGFVGLHEAAAITGNPEFRKAEDKLSQFLCRIQTRSNTIPELDGTWYRAFDFNRWEYWGSDGDWGWGAWCTETGWIQGALVTTFTLRQMNTSLWDLVVKRSLSSYLEKNLNQLFPDNEDSKITR
jgi:hypothetical protein